MCPISPGGAQCEYQIRLFLRNDWPDEYLAQEPGVPGAGSDFPLEKFIWVTSSQIGRACGRNPSMLSLRELNVPWQGLLLASLRSSPLLMGVAQAVLTYSDPHCLPASAGIYLFPGVAAITD